jgi:hypothetical protein
MCLADGSKLFSLRQDLDFMQFQTYVKRNVPENTRNAKFTPDGADYTITYLSHLFGYLYVEIIYIITAIPLQAWTGPEGSRKLKLPDFKTVGT